MGMDGVSPAVIEIDEVNESEAEEETGGAPLALELPEYPEWVLPEPTKANERKIADLQAGNKMLLGRLVARKAIPHPMAVLAARVKALLAISPDGGEGLAAAEEIENPLMVVTNAIESMCMTQVNGHPGLKQAFDLAFEEQMEKLLKDVESRVNKAMLEAMQPNGPGTPEVRTKGGLILPGQ